MKPKSKAKSIKAISNPHYFQTTAFHAWTLLDAYREYANKNPTATHDNIVKHVRSELSQIGEQTRDPSKRQRAQQLLTAIDSFKSAPGPSTPSAVNINTRHVENQYIHSTVSHGTAAPLTTDDEVQSISAGEKREADEETSGLDKKLRIMRAESVSFEAPTTLQEAWNNFMRYADFSNLHEYSYEKFGIIPFGNDIRWNPSIPSQVYRLLEATTNIQEFPLSPILVEYRKTIISSKFYGLPEITEAIFTKPANLTPAEEISFRFLQRILFIYSDTIHEKKDKVDLTESEATYCHYAVWPLLRVVLRGLSTQEKVVCNFKIGETVLNSRFCDNDAVYLADGKFSLNEGGLEVLLFEASGPLSNHDLTKHVYDFIKGSFGSTAMLKTVLRTYCHADEALLDTISVVYVQTSGKDDCIRVWLVRPAANGTIVTMERVLKATMKATLSNHGDLLGMVDFLWGMKDLVERSVSSIIRLKESHNNRLLDGKKNKTPLDQLLQPHPLKPRKADGHCSGITSLDPVSFICDN
ncbi:hypothetical protein BJV82DRAFT_606389 [Fennellomyces sp. T-0311]|nr:hypothetical protein BJV82DRAFT_606389 [Fennellomyces sp. T-0311]